MIRERTRPFARGPLLAGCLFLLGLLSLAPARVQAEPHGPASVAASDSAEGEFVTRIARMLDGSSRTSHHLVDGPNEVELLLPEGMEIPRQATVKARGEFVSEGVLQVADYEVLVPAPIPTIDPEPRPPRRIALIIVFWDQQGLNNASARDSLFLDGKSTNVFYGENSYGKDMMAGNVFGPYQISAPGNCNPSYIADQAMQAFAAKGHNENDYQQFMFHFAGGLSCGWAGLANVGAPDAPARNSWYNNTFGCVVRNQELAHNYGMSHSRAFTCDGGGQDCLPPTSVGNNYPQNLEYGDPWDPLGNGCHHINVAHKTYMKWLEGCNIVTASSDGKFNLMPTELPCNGTQALRLPTSDGRYYWLEYRGDLGLFDAGLEGVLLHVATANARTPFFVNVGDGGRLYAGDSFSDPDGAWSFTVESIADGRAVIDVQFTNGGDGMGPTCYQGAGNPEMEAGAIGSLECAAEPFPLDTEPPTVAITYPAPDQYFDAGSDFIITAEAMDDRNVTELILYVDKQPVQNVFTNPGEWEVVNIPQGVYELGVVAWDGPNWAPSEAINIYVGVDPPAGTGSGSGTSGTSSGTGGTDSGSTGTSGGDTDTDGSNQTDSKSGCGCRNSTPGPEGLAFMLIGLGMRWRIRRRAAQVAG